jgi:hypothetical protein
LRTDFVFDAHTFANAALCETLERELSLKGPWHFGYGMDLDLALQSTWTSVGHLNQCARFRLFTTSRPTITTIAFTTISRLTWKKLPQQFDSKSDKRSKVRDCASNSDSTSRVAQDSCCASSRLLHWLRTRLLPDFGDVFRCFTIAGSAVSSVVVGDE